MSIISAHQLNEHLPVLHRFALALTKNTHDAEDLVQDCIERALSRSHLFEPGTNLRAWLLTICRRLFLNMCRKNAVRGVQLEYDDAKAKIAVKAMQDISMEVQDVKSAFRSLPVNDRVILSLVAIEGLRYDEAAVLLNIPIGTVRSRLSRARARLSELLKLDISTSAGASRVRAASQVSDQYTE